MASPSGATFPSQSATLTLSAFAERECRIENVKCKISGQTSFAFFIFVLPSLHLTFYTFHFTLYTLHSTLYILNSLELRVVNRRHDLEHAAHLGYVENDLRSGLERGKDDLSPSGLRLLQDLDEDTKPA